MASYDGTMETNYSQISVNLPADLKRLLGAISQSNGTDITGIALRAIHEYLAGQHVAGTDPDEPPRYVDAHGARLRSGDQVVIYPGTTDLVVGKVVGLGVDAQGIAVATVQVPGHRRPYAQAMSTLQKRTPEGDEK